MATIRRNATACLDCGTLSRSKGNHSPATPSYDQDHLDGLVLDIPDDKRRRRSLARWCCDDGRVGADPGGHAAGHDGWLSGPAKIEPGVKIVGTFPANSHQQIIYPIAATTTAKAEAADYLVFLRTSACKAIFERYGFTFLVSPTT